MPNKVTLVRQDGTRIDATPDQADKLRLLGYKEETPEASTDRLVEEGKANYYQDQQGTAAVEGLARGATLGLSDYALGSDDTRNRAKYNPGTAMASEVLGTVAPMLIPGLGEEAAATTASSIASRTPVALVSRGAEKAAAALGFEGSTGRIVKAGLEGAVFGAAQTGDHAYLSGDKLTAEAVVHGIGWGTLFGAGLAGAGEAVTGAGNRAAEKVAEVTRQEAAKVAKPPVGALNEVGGQSYAAFKAETDTLSKQLRAASDQVDAIMSPSNRKFSALQVRRGPQAAAPIEEAGGGGGEFPVGVRDARDMGGTRGNSDVWEHQAPGTAAGEAGEFSSAIRDARDMGGERGNSDVWEHQPPSGIPRTSADIADEDAVVTIRARDLHDRGYFEPPGQGQDFVKADKARAAIRDGQRDPVRAVVDPDGGIELTDGRNRTAAAIEADAPLKIKFEKTSQPVGQGGAELRGGASGVTDVSSEELAGHMQKLRAAYKRIGKAMDAGTGSADKVAAATAKYQEAVTAVSSRLGATASGSTLSAMNELVELKAAQKALSSMPHTVEQFAAMTDARAESLFAAMSRAKKLSSFPVLGRAVDEAAGSFSTALGIEPSGVDGLRASWRSAKASLKAERAPTPVVPEPPEVKPGFLAKAAGRAAGAFTGAKTLAATGSKLAAYAAYNTTKNVVAGTLTGAGLSAARTAVIGRLNTAAASYLPKAGRAISRVAPAVEPLAVKLDGTLDTSTRDRQKLATSRLVEFAAAAPHVNDTMYQAVAGIGVTQPSLAPAMHSAAVSMFETLRGMMPADPGIVSRLSSIWNADPLQVAVMGRQYEVFHNAVGVAERMLRTGNFDPVSINAMRELTPAVYQELRSAVLNRVTTSGLLNTLDYGQQIGLGAMLDIPLHSSMRPEFIASSLMLHSKRRELLPTPGNPGAEGGQRKPQDTPGATQGNITESR